MKPGQRLTSGAGVRARAGEKHAALARALLARVRAARLSDQAYASSAGIDVKDLQKVRRKLGKGMTLTRLAVLLMRAGGRPYEVVKRPEGGQIKDGPVKKDYQVTIDPDRAEQLRREGKGNLSKGIDWAAQTETMNFRVLPSQAASSQATPSQRSGPGRPRLGRLARKRVCIKLYPSIAKQVKAFGDGNLSEGIDRLARVVAGSANE